MLESLTIRHVALIDEVTIRFHDGMQVLTGETGAGKSIVVDSVNLILGGRAERELIRSGCERASVEAVFNVRNNPNVHAFMEQEGIEYDGSTVTVYREISVNGKNTCRICGVMIAVNRLKDLAALLMDLYGQSEHQFLTEPERHLSFLDQTGDETHRDLLQKIRTEYECFLENHRAYAKLVKLNENREARLRSLERDLEELREAHIEPGEAERLLEKRKKLAGAEKLAKAMETVIECISGEERGEDSGLERIRNAKDTLKSIADQDDNIRTVCERCESLYYEMEDIVYQLTMMKERMGYEPDALEKTDSRLDLIHRIERKYSLDADDIHTKTDEMDQEYRTLSELEEQIRKMSAEHKRLLKIYRNTAKELTVSRQLLSSAFENRMMKELGDLGMANTHFHIEFKENETGRPLMPTETGDDRIEFMMSPNPGEPLKPLAKIASGGELSRLMLAVKTLESTQTGVESMVFDEIDTGISGRMAQVVAEKMIMISRERQVICVTHLPQIAAAADYQYLVQKSVSDGRTNTAVTELDHDGRIGEISRMISGADGITEESNAYASKMLQAASEKKIMF